jgi:hypothetical protein
MENVSCVIMNACLLVPYLAWRGPHRKHFHRIVAWNVCLQLCCLAFDVRLLLRANCGNVFTEPLPSNG